MALTEDEERAEHLLRINQMTIDIEKMRADMRWESRKFLASMLIASAALLGAGVAIGNYMNPRSASAPVQQIILPPGTTIQIPK